METYIELKLFATLNRYQPPTADRYPIRSGMRVADLTDELGIPAKEAKLIFIDGRQGRPETILQAGQRVGIFPPVGGG